MNWTRQRGRARPDLPLAEFCAVELACVDRQIWLLRNINWWYTGPTLFGCCVFLLGTLLSLSGLPAWAWCVAIAIFFAYFLLGWVVYGLNQKALRTELLPLREELEEIHDSLVEEPPALGDAE